MVRWHFPLLLTGLALCEPPGVSAGAEARVPPFAVVAIVGPHSLCYNITASSQDGFVHTRFLAEGRLDDEPFLHYDSEKGRAEPRGPWAQTVLGAETWDTETRDVAERGKKLRATLADINALQQPKGGAGSHSLQETWGCETQEDNRTRGFWEFHYDGEPFLSYRPETLSWKVHPSSAETLAVKVKEQWEEDHTQSKASWAHVQGDLCETLQKYLPSWMDFMQETVPPAVNVTCSEVLNGTVTLTCVAFGFYPGNLSLAWHKDGERLSPDAQESGGALPYGNGTYQTRVTTRIPQGEEQKFSCHVGHGGTHSTHPALCGKGLAPPGPWYVAVAVIAAVLVGVIIIPLCVHLWKKRRTPCSAGASDLRSQQVLDQQLLVPGPKAKLKFLRLFDKSQQKEVCRRVDIL